MGKKEGDEEDEEDEILGSPPRDSHTPPEHAMMPHHLQNQAAFQHMRHHAPSASPPMNGLPFHHRHPSPGPPVISRPNSRSHIRRQSSNLVPPQHQMSQPPQQQPNYAYMPNPPFYNAQAAQGMPAKVPQGPPAAPQYQYTHPPATHPQVQQFIQQEQRRQSMPPAFPQDNRQPSMTVPSPPQPEQNNMQQSMQNQFQSPPPPQPKPLPSAAKQHSIFTPIDDSRSMLAQHWGNSNNIEMPRSEGPVKIEMGPRSQSIDVASMARAQANGHSPPQPRPQQPPNQPQRTASTSSVPNIGPPSRTNSMQTDPKRPKLTVQIPSEHSDAGSATADSSPKESGTTGVTPARTSTVDSHSSGIQLPPPSPSASALMSAGAIGPPNPFARPPPPNNNNSYGSRSEMETPISALPSRFVEGNLLPSPSSFYPEWGFGRPADNMLPSPLTFQPTPIVTNGPSFGREDPSDRKRKTSEGSDGGNQKRMKG
jgi:MADS-box transcription factor